MKNGIDARGRELYLLARKWERDEDWFRRWSGNMFIEFLLECSDRAISEHDDLSEKLDEHLANIKKPTEKTRGMIMTECEDKYWSFYFQIKNNHNCPSRVFSVNLHEDEAIINLKSKIRSIVLEEAKYKKLAKPYEIRLCNDKGEVLSGWKMV